MCFKINDVSFSKENTRRPTGVDGRSTWAWLYKINVARCERTPFKLTEIPYGSYKLGLDFRDGSVYLVHTPGHSTGQFSVLVQTKRGWVLLASDVGLCNEPYKS